MGVLGSKLMTIDIRAMHGLGGNAIQAISAQGRRSVIFIRAALSAKIAV
jgi:hypothetical protein